MTAALALLKLFAGDALGCIWKWLKHASFWQLVSICLCVFICVQHFQLVSARHSAAKWESQTGKLQTQLDTETEKNKAAEKQTAQISKQLRDRTDEENRRIAGDANALRLRGPGKAVCPGVPTAPGGHKQAAPSSDAPVAQLPNTRGAELIALPFDDTIGFGKSYDELLNENKAWRDWHDQVLKVWPKTTEAPAH